MENGLEGGKSRCAQVSEEVGTIDKRGWIVKLECWRWNNMAKHKRGLGSKMDKT